MPRLLKVVAVVLLAISAFAQSGDEAQTPTNMPVTTPGGTANYVSLFSNKNTIVKSAYRPERRQCGHRDRNSVLAFDRQRTHSEPDERILSSPTTACRAVGRPYHRDS